MEEPNFVASEVAAMEADLSAGAVVATPRAQQGVVAARRELPEAWDIMSHPIPDPTRTMPANFSQSVYDTYMRMPTRGLPTSENIKGKYNFTLKDARNAAIEVQSLPTLHAPTLNQIGTIAMMPQ